MTGGGNGPSGEADDSTGERDDSTGERTPNPRQRELIESLDGIYKVDAGPGTGKTFSITRRYAHLLDSRPVEPEDVLLITFTNNAAAEMKDRIIDRTDESPAALRDAPINTFHGIAHQLLRRHGLDAPQLLGIDEQFSPSTTILDDEVLETQRFRTFVEDFAARHPEHEHLLRVLADPVSLLGLIEQLAAKGVFPTAEGWYRNGEAHLDGDVEAFEALFAERNQPREGARGPIQSALRRDLGGYGRDACYLPEAPSRNDLRGAGDGTQVDGALARSAFDADRADLKGFVHDVYVEYLEFALSRNYVTFGFLQLLAFVLLMEDHDLREAVGFEYVMIDEFQDTSELQFKLALLLADAGNLCVVGDWKQSIYGFQYAAVENIRHFEGRLSRFAAELNGDGTPGDSPDRVDFPVDDVTEIALERNYRATQDLLDFSEVALTVEATDRETVDGVAIREEITSLTSATAHDESRIEAFAGPTDEYAAIFERIGEIVGNEAYAVTDEETGETRPPTLADITVLTRTRDFGREFQRRAAAYDLPVAYEGEVELLTTDQALLVLAWLRILEGVRADRGWAVVLERAGYTLPEVEHILEYDQEEYDRIPDDLAAFRASLAELESVVGVARRVLDRYGFDDAYADGVIELLDEVVSDTRLTRGDVIRFLEAGIDAGATYPVSDSPGQDSVTVQTIHATKGLEHSIVIVANMNRYRFPPTGGSRDRIRFDDPIGLRQSKVYAEAHGQPHLYDNWRYDVLSACLRGQYDEERRLLYVAMTRAKHHLLFAAGEEPSPLFENLPLDPDLIADPSVDPFETGETEQTRLEVRIPEIDAPAGYSAHDLMDESVFEGGVGESPEMGESPGMGESSGMGESLGAEREIEGEFGGGRRRGGRGGGRHRVDSGGGGRGADSTGDRRGRAFGREVHDFAERYARREGAIDPPSVDGEDVANVVALLDPLIADSDADLRVEENVYLPLAVDGERVTISGTADLVVVREDRVEILDYKTDLDRRAEPEYRKQLSVYYHVAREVFPDREIRLSLFYTAAGERIDVEPLDRAELVAGLAE